MNIDRIYECYVCNNENNFMNQNNSLVDLDWIQSKLTREDYLKLEQLISCHVIQNEKSTFKDGFQIAWDLFHACSTHKKSH